MFIYDVVGSPPQLITIALLVYLSYSKRNVDFDRTLVGNAPHCKAYKAGYMRSKYRPHGAAYPG